MEEWITKDGMPCACPGMLIHSVSGLWFQVTSCDVDGSNLCGHYLRLTEGGDGVVIMDSLIKGFNPTADTVSELYIYEREHGVPRRDIINIMKNNKDMVSTRVYVWRQRIRMTVAEIEEKLGHRVEIISEKEN